MAEMPYCPRSQFRGQLPELKDIYRLLDAEEFRLLQVHGYDNFGILRCSLRHVTFKQDKVIPYTAISYTWNESEKLWYGDYDTSPKPVRIDGVAVLVPDKVANIICLALQVMTTMTQEQSRTMLTSTKHNKQFIWIDAVCINQSDKNEKSHQVARMGTIYSCATEVLSFLGSPSPETDELIDQLHIYCRPGGPQRRMSAKFLAAMINFFANDYWRRTWIFQELALAKTIHIICGSRALPIEPMLQLNDSLEDPMVGFRGALTAMRFLVQSKSLLKRVWKNGSIDAAVPGDYVMTGVRKTFLEVLKESRRHNGCYDPRDMLYSRMALASDSDTMVPYTDYEIPVEELYTRFATNAIILSKSLEIITFATSTAMQIPTWVPDWTSLTSGWSTEKKQNNLKDSLATLQWQEVGLPRISRCRTELMVQGRILKTLRHRDYDYEGRYMSMAMSLTHAGDKFSSSEVPRAKDVICVLRGCPLLAHLRPVGQHFVVVARNSEFQDKLDLSTTGLITKFQNSEQTNRDVWTLASIEDVQSKREEIFRIR